MGRFYFSSIEDLHTLCCEGRPVKFPIKIKSIFMVSYLLLENVSKNQTKNNGRIDEEFDNVFNN